MSFNTCLLVWRIVLERPTMEKIIFLSSIVAIVINIWYVNLYVFRTEIRFMFGKQPSLRVYL